MKKIKLLTVAIMAAVFSLSAQVPHHTCSLPQYNTHGTGFARYLRSDNCDRQAGSVPYQNPQNILVQNSSLVFDGQCLWLNGFQLCPNGGGACCDSNAIDSARNGLTRIGKVIELGGTLLHTTIIDAQYNDFFVGSQSPDNCGGYNSFIGYIPSSNAIVLGMNKYESCDSIYKASQIYISTDTNNPFITLQAARSNNKQSLIVMDSTVTSLSGSEGVTITTNCVINSRKKNIELNTAPNTSTGTGFILIGSLPEYLTQAAANADANLPHGALYQLVTDDTTYRKK